MIRMKRIRAVCLVLMMLLVITGVLSGCAKTEGESEKKMIRVGSKDFTEGLIVGEIYALR